MQRIDWRLIRPPRDGADDGRLVARALVQLWPRINSLEEGGHSESHMVELERRYEELTLSPCEAAAAPIIADDTDWETRMLEEYELLDVDEDLEEFLNSRRHEPDCERCPYASNYSLFPMDPCEFSAGGLVEVLADKNLGETAGQSMDPARMRSYADALETALSSGEFTEHPAIHAEDYLEKAISFLRFWSNLGFRIEPALLDERIFELADAQESDETDDQQTLH